MNLKFTNLNMNINKIYSNTAKDLSRIISESFLKSYANINSVLDKSLQSANSMLYFVDKELIDNYGWFFPYLTTKNMLNVYKILKSNAENKRDLIDSLIVTAYSEGILKEFLTIWKTEKLKEFYPAIKEAIENHIDGRYYSSILIFTAEIDGLLINTPYFRKGEWFTQKKLKIAANTELLCEYDENSKRKDFQPEMSKFFDKYYANLDIAISNPTFVNRNSVVHGADQKYATKINSLKMIVFFNTLKKATCEDKDYYVDRTEDGTKRITFNNLL